MEADLHGGRAVKRTMPETPPDFDGTCIVERPDGFYWWQKETGRLFGPFPTLLDVVNDMNCDPEAGAEPTAALREAEEEIGIADWIDPETGVPAEEQVPRLEEH
jgi:hypothetical protein